MPHDKKYYETWLRSLDIRQLELVGMLLLIEVEIYEMRKTILRAKELTEDDNYILGSLLMQEIHFKNLHRQYTEELDEIDLDITHTRFMIEQLKHQ